MRIISFIFSILILISSSTFSGNLLIYDNVNIDKSDLKLIKDVSTKALLEITGFLFDTKWPEEKKIKIIIETREEIEKLRNIKLPENVTGCAISNDNTIYLIYPFKNISTYPYNSLNSLIYHELFHIIIADYLNGAKIPLWLNEGTAMYLSGDFMGDSLIKLAYASITDNLIPLGSLNTRFPSKRMSLAYIQSLNAVTYLVDNHGETSLQLLFDRVRSTGQFEKAFYITYNKTDLQFYQEWKNYVRKEFNLYTILFQKNIIWAFLAFILIIFFFIKKMLARKKIKKWQEDEESSLEHN